MKRLALAGLLALAACSQESKSCNDDSDCGATSGKVLCDKGASSSVCRATCGSNGKQCSPTTDIPPEGNNDDCGQAQHCLCNPARGYFFCEPR